MLILNFFQVRMECFKELLWDWYIYEDRTASETYHCFQQYLTASSTYDLELSLDNDIQHAVILAPSLRTLQRQFHDWNFSKHCRYKFDPVLGTRLWVLFYDMGLNDSEILRFLHKEGHQISIKMYVHYILYFYF